MHLFLTRIITIILFVIGFKSFMRAYTHGNSRAIYVWVLRKARADNGTYINWHWTKHCQSWVCIWDPSLHVIHCTYSYETFIWIMSCSNSPYTHGMNSFYANINNIYINALFTYIHDNIFTIYFTLYTFDNVSIV